VFTLLIRKIRNLTVFEAMFISALVTFHIL